jgi:hypothetical protein
VSLPPLPSSYAGDPAARAALFPSQHPQPLPSGSTPQAPSILSPVSPVQGSIASFTSGSAHSPLTYPAAAAGGMGLGPEPRTPILPGNGPSWFSSTTSTSSTSSGGGSNGAQKGGTGGVRAAVSLSKTSEQEVRDALTLLDSDQVREKCERSESLYWLHTQTLEVHRFTTGPCWNVVLSCTASRAARDMCELRINTCSLLLGCPDKLTFTHGAFAEQALSSRGTTQQNCNKEH